MFVSAMDEAKDSMAGKDWDFLSRLVVGIGEVAQMTGVPVRQLRYWTQKGILISIAEDKNVRQYDYWNIKKVFLIKELLDEGYTLEAADKKVSSRMNAIDEALQQYLASKKS